MESKDDVQIVIAEQMHKDGILELAESGFNKNEPVSVAMKTLWEEVEESWKKKVCLSLMDPLCSHVAINSANKVIGFRLSRIIDMKNYKPGDSINDMTEEGLVRTILDRLTMDWPKVLIDDNGQPCGKVLQFFALSVHPEYGGRGLGEKMCRENVANAEKLGCDYCLATGSNWMSFRIFEKLGFKMMAEVDFDEYKDVFKITDSKQKYSRAYYLKLGHGVG